MQALVRHFSGVRAVDGVSLEVASGQCVALIGPNGAGKSTLFACIAGQQRPDAGQVLWQGQPLPDQTLLIHAEQGLGDTLQFLRYIDLAAKRALRVLLLIQESLTSMRLRPNSTIPLRSICLSRRETTSREVCNSSAISW